MKEFNIKKSTCKSNLIVVKYLFTEHNIGKWYKLFILP